jgi:hypothetical protein
MKSRLARALEGWQAGLVVVLTAVLVLAVVAPRPVFPEDIPLPLPQHRELKRLVQQETNRAHLAVQQELPFEVRQVGETFRRYGVAVASGDKKQASYLHQTLARQVYEARRHSEELMLRLRAYQTESFLRELRVLESTGVESVELQELGGEFVQTAREAGWLRPRRSGMRLVVDDDVRRILFRKRWNEVLAVSAPSFRISLDEERAFHAFLLDNPIASVPPGADERMRCQAANEYLLRKVTAYGAIDSEYPTDYVRGILLLRLGRHQAALMPLVRFVENNPDGPHTLRARNTLRYAQAQMHTMLTQ